MIIAPVVRAQFTVTKNSYYITLATTKGVILNDTEGEPKNIRLPKGSVILVFGVDKDKVYFRIDRYNDDVDTKDLNKTDLYSIPLSEFTEQYFRFRAGFSGGLLNAPFKYRPDKQKIYPGGNIAAYGSWQIVVGGLEVKPLLFGGVTTVTTTDRNVDSTQVVTKAGITFGLGIGLDVFSSFDFGLVAGWDFIDPTWESNGRVWYSISFNFKL
jgi:hypothetical protein